MRRLLDQLTETPTLLLGRHMDILAWNAIAAFLVTDFGALPARAANFLLLLFTNPALREMHVAWEHDARGAVAALRMDAARDSGDAELAALVGELSLQDPDFRAWWGGNHFTSATYGTKQYNHRLVGHLTLDCDLWASPDGSGQQTSRSDGRSGHAVA